MCGSAWELAVFAAERRPPATWAQVMEAWNQEHAKDQYTRETVFARDCTAAQKRLLSPTLDADALLLVVSRLAIAGICVLFASQ